MNASINLLPWRQQQHQRRLKQWALCFCVVVALIGAVYYLSIRWHQQLVMQIQQEQTQSQHGLRELTSMKQQINQLRTQRVKTEKLRPISSRTALYLSNLLADLPLGRGELVEFSLQQKTIVLKGFVENHEAFTALQQALNAESLFQQVELVQFQPEQVALWFEFKIQLTLALTSTKQVQWVRPKRIDEVEKWAMG